jgi:ribosomal 50S subunit-recycling heat shock protein
MKGSQDEHSDTETESTPAGTQRLDKWLWFARVIKSRTLAAQLVEDG